MYYAERQKLHKVSKKEAIMRVEFNRTGKERKELVETLSRITEEKAEYLGAPSMAYIETRKPNKYHFQIL